DRPAGVARVQRREHQVAGLGGGERPLGRIPIPHLAHEDHVRILTQAVAKAPLEALHVPPHLALRHQRSLARQAVLDGVFQRDDAAGRDSAMRSMSAATVVDLPAPVMPVSSTRPCCAARMSCHKWLGNPICSTAVGAASSARMAITGPSLSKKAFSRKHRSSVAKEPSIEPCSSSAVSSALLN